MDSGFISCHMDFTSKIRDWGEEDGGKDSEVTSNMMRHTETCEYLEVETYTLSNRYKRRS